MFPLNVTTYIKLALCAVLLGGSAYLGYSFEHSRFVAYKIQVETAGKIQEAKNEQIVKEQKVTTERITNDYKNSLARIHSYYSGLHDPSGSQLSGSSTTVPFVDGTPSDPQFIEKCAMTTQQLESLQQWLREQVGIK